MVQPVTKLKKGQIAKIVSIEGTSRRRLIEMGLTINSKIQLLQNLLFGGNVIIVSEEGKYSLRSEQADVIQVQILKDNLI